MPRAKKDLQPVSIFGNKEETKASAIELGTRFDNLVIKKLMEISLLDAIKPDLLSTNNEIRAVIRETRAKVNEIINILNVR